VLYLWQQRAKELHDALWGLWEDLRAGKTIDMTRPEDGPMRGHHQ
jgi:hypothetical protein